MNFRVGRSTVLAKMRARIKAGQPILITGAGNGMVASIADNCGVDAIVVYNSGKYRMDGLPSIAGNLPIGDANEVMYNMGKYQILNQVAHTPVIAGVYGVDPTRNMEVFLPQLAELRYSGVINFPTVGKISGAIRRELEEVGLGFGKELQMLKMAVRMGFLTMAYCYSPEEARQIAAAGVDIIIAHCGLTSGGNVGVKNTRPLDDTIDYINELLSQAKREVPEIIALCHGGMMESPADVAEVLANTCAQGFVGSSSVERIGPERVIRETIEAYMGIDLGGGKPGYIDITSAGGKRDVV